MNFNNIFQAFATFGSIVLTSCGTTPRGANLAQGSLSNAQVKSQGWFTEGSSREDVARVMGTPNSLSKSTDIERWRYGSSSITFKQGKVSEWSDYSRNLRVRMTGKAPNSSTSKRSTLSNQDSQWLAKDYGAISRRGISARIKKEYGVEVSSDCSLSSLLDVESRLGAARRIKAKHGLSYDYQTTSLSALLDIESRASSAKRLFETTGKQVRWSDHRLSDLLAMESKPSRVPTRSRSYRPSSYRSSPPTISKPRRYTNSRGSRYYDSSYRPSVGNHYVAGHYRKDGTYVKGHNKTNRDDSFWNNWSSNGNVNPYTGRTGRKKPSSSYRGYSSGGSTYVRGYYRKNGTYVSGHSRTSR